MNNIRKSILLYPLARLSSKSCQFRSLHKLVALESSANNQKALLDRNFNIKLTPIQRNLTLSTLRLEEAESEEVHSEKKYTDTEVKKLIYDEAMKLVCEHGWTRQTLKLAAVNAGYAGEAEGLFNGGEGLAVEFIKNCNEELVAYLKELALIQENPETKFPVPEFIRNAIEFRLRLLIPVLEVWPQGLAKLHSPKVIKDTVAVSTKMVDDIWYYAGDRSTDISWYTKRGMLAKLYFSTQLAMLNDSSPDFKDTWDFLDRRLDDIKIMGQVSRKLSTVPEALEKVGSVGLTTLLNIAGIGQTKR